MRIKKKKRINAFPFQNKMSNCSRDQVNYQSFEKKVK